MEYRRDIDGLRGVAVLLVLTYHLDPRVLPGGYTGVDIFFVISGYLISILLWRQLEDGTFSLRKFHARRLWRLLPAQYAVVVLTLCAAVAFFPQTDVRATAASATSSVLGVSNFFLALQSGYFDVSAKRKLLLHTWSLAAEQQFYLIWPSILAVLYKNRHILSKAVRTCVAVLLIVALVLLSEYCTHVLPPFAYFLLPFRLFQFSIGAGLHLLPVPSSTRIQHTVALTGVLCIAYSAQKSFISFPGFSALLPSVAAAMLMHSPRSFVTRLLQSNGPTELGRISYSVYLVHWPLISSFYILTGRRMLPKECFVTFLCSIAFGFALHHSVEEKFRKGSLTSGPYGKRSFSFLPLLSFGAAVCVLAYFAPSASKNKFRRIDRTIRPTWTDAEDGVNRTAVLQWTSRLAPPKKVWDWTRERKSSVPYFNSRRAFYKPPRRIPSAKVLLVGDSHGERILPAFVRLGMEKNFQIDALVSTACPPLLGVHKKYNSKLMKGATQACFEDQIHWKREVEKKRYDFVVLAARWTWHFESSVYGEFSVPQETLFRDKENPKASVADLRILFKEAMQNTIKPIVRSGANVILVSQVPNIGRTTRGCLEIGSALRPGHRSQPRECVGVPRHVALQRLQFLNTLITRMDYGHDRVTGFIPSRYLCDNYHDRFCMSVYDRHEIYTDSNHLSTFGAVLLYEKWAADAFSGVKWTHRNTQRQK